MSQNQGQSGSRLSGPALLGAAVGVFILCCIIQAACGSSMFSTSYPATDSTMKDLLINVTFWPGWLMTAALAIKGVAALRTDR